VFGQIIGDTVYFETQRQLGTTIALTISMTFPVFTLIFSFIFLKAPIKPVFFLSLFLIASGVIIIQKFQFNEQISISKAFNIISESKTNRIGIAVLLGFIAAISWALGIVFTEYALNQVASLFNKAGSTSLIANAIRFPFASFVLIFMSYNRENKTFNFSRSWSGNTWKWLIIGAVLGTSIGAFLYAEAILIAGAAFVSILWTASPLFALPISWVLNREKINKKGVVGVLITTSGVILLLI
jgi:drug/metabolite transporter (DMT)-like permease